MPSSINLPSARALSPASSLFLLLAVIGLSTAWLYAGLTPMAVVRSVRWGMVVSISVPAALLVWIGRLATDRASRRGAAARPAAAMHAAATACPGRGGAPHAAALKTAPKHDEDIGLAPDLAAALADLDSGRYAQALAAAAPHALSAAAAAATVPAAVRTDALRICALATARLARWPESLCYWDRLFTLEPCAHNALQVATSAVMAGDIRGGEAWLASARDLNKASREMPALAMLTNFVTALADCGQWGAALPYLDEIKGFYLASGVTDPTYLFVRGMPSFGVFLDKSAAIIDATLGPARAPAWYLAMLPRLDDAGARQLNDWLAQTFASEAAPAA
jgi:hypothetical protein